MVTHAISQKSMHLAILLCIFLSACLTTSATKDEIERAKNLSLEGMKIVENWNGNSADIEKASRLFNEALSLDPKCVEAFTGLGRVSLRQGLISGLKYHAAALESAIDYADRAISINNKYLKAHKLRGRVLTLSGKYDDAFKEADIIERIDSLSCEHIDLRGGIYEVRGDIGAAIAEFKKGLSCPSLEHAKRPEIYSRLAEMYFRNKDYENSSIYYEKAIDSNPDSAWNYGNYSRVLTAKGELEKAEDMVKKALSLMDYGMAHVYLSRIYYRRGEIFLGQKQLTKAEKQFLLAAAEYPEDKYAYYQLAYIQTIKGNCDKAAEITDYILKLDPADEIARKMILNCIDGRSK